MKTYIITEDDIFLTLRSLDSGLQFAQEVLGWHDLSLGRTIRKNKMWAEQLEKDISEIMLARDRLYAIKHNEDFKE